MKIIKKVCISIFSILFLGVFGSAFAVRAPSTVVLSGIDSPRGMDLDSAGNLYVASAGFGGSGAPFLLTRSADFGPICQGNSGKVFKVTQKGVVTTVINNLPSHAGCDDFNGPFGLGPKGGVAAGPNGLKVSDAGKGKVTLFMTFSGSTEETNDFCLPGGAVVTRGSPDTVSCLSGFRPSNPYNLVQSQTELWGSNVNIYNTVGKVDLSVANPQYVVLYNQMKYIEGIFNVDHINTAGPFHFPGPTNLENDVYDLLVLDPNLNIILGVDSGANAIWTLAGRALAFVEVVMPNVGCSKAPCTVGTNLTESVPTSIAQNPTNGKIYVGELAAFTLNAARVYEMNLSTYPATLTSIKISGGRTGLSNIVGMAFDKQGNLYVVEYNKNGFSVPLVGGPGALVKLHFTDPYNAIATVIDDETLTGPTGITIGNGKIYVGNKQDIGLHLAEVRAYNIP